MRRARYVSLLIQGIAVAVVFLGLFCLGVGVGGFFRKRVELESERVVVVVVDAPPTSSKFFRLERGYTGVGCVIRNQRCVCDSPYGPLSFPLFVECDVVRYKFYRGVEE